MSGRRDAAADGLLALLTLARDSADGMGIVKGVMGGLVFIMETSRVRWISDTGTRR